jgi:agmatinase
MDPRLSPIPDYAPTFLEMPRCTDLATLDADITVVGIPYTVPYNLNALRQPSSPAPETIRNQSIRLAPFLGHHDFDFDGPTLAGLDVRIVDCGNVAMRPGHYTENAANVTGVIETILARGAIPFVLGGDHAVPIPVWRAYRNHGPIYIVQVDAHIDWRDEREGIRDGLSSPMRRASELAWVSGMAQIGIRGVGSARTEEVEAAKAYGSLIIKAEEIHDLGVKAALERIPRCSRYYITIDADGLDPTIAPGVGSPAYGGLTYPQVINLIRGVAEKGAIVGYDIVEVQPEVDVQHLTSYLAARLTLVAIGALAHGNQIGIHNKSGL